MDEMIECPQCHTSVRPTDYYCFNCGKNLHPAPPDTSSATLIGYFFGSIILPPLGIVWGFKYTHHSDIKIKIFGWSLIILTILELVIVTKGIIDLYNNINDQVLKQMENLQGL